MNRAAIPITIQPRSRAQPLRFFNGREKPARAETTAYIQDGYQKWLRSHAVSFLDYQVQVTYRCQKLSH